MRAILALSLVLLALTLALDHSRTLFPRPRAPGALADRALAITVVARGPLLPAARAIDLVCPGAGIRVGERTLVDTESGLLATFVGPGSDLRGTRRFDLASTHGDARALRAAVADANVGDVLVLASCGRLEPPSEERADLEQALTALGARARPGTATPESWALIALRLERGWVPLAESYSLESGVTLAFVLAPDLETYAGFRGDFARVAAPARSEIFLHEELAHARLRTAGVEARRGVVRDRPLQALAVPPASGPDGTVTPGRVAWDGVALGPGSGVLAWVGLADGADAGSDGVVFEVRVDGERVHAENVLPGAPWKVVQVDLRRFAGRRVALELAVDPRASGAGDAALWGQPLLVHGYDRAPVEVWAEER